MSREIDASAATVWALVSDLPGMGRWSGENEGGKWLAGADGPSPGATFRGANRNGVRRWKTKATVVDSIPGKRFSFRVTSVGIPVSVWSYDFVPTASGCQVTESWLDQRPAWFKTVSSLASGVKDRDAFTDAEMTKTLNNLAAAAEG